MDSSVDWQAVLLDLLNTTPVVDGMITDELDVPWLTRRGAAADAIGDVRRVRADLQRVVSGAAEPIVLDEYLRDVAQTPAVVDGGIAWTIDADWTARVVLAWGELHAEAPGRLRPCANGECRRYLLDRTRAGTARWCSMSVCGNRMKARRHYDRTAGRADESR